MHTREAATLTPNSNEGRALWMSTIAFTVCFAVWTIFSIIGVRIKDQLGLSEAEFGLLVGTPILTGSLARIALGIWTDRYGGRLVFTLTMLAASVATVLLAAAQTYPEMLLAALGVGFAGGSFAVGVAYVSRFFHAEYWALAKCNWRMARRTGFRQHASTIGRALPNRCLATRRLRRQSRFTTSKPAVTGLRVSQATALPAHCFLLRSPSPFRAIGRPSNLLRHIRRSAPALPSLPAVPAKARLIGGRPFVPASVSEPMR